MRRVLRLSAVATGGVILGSAFAMVVARQLGVTQITLVALLVGMPFAAIPTAAAAGLFAAAKSRVGVGLALALTGGLVGLQVPQFLADDNTSSGAEITVLTVNVAHGDADAAAIVDQARSSKADFLAVQELTQAEVDDLTAAGIDELMPYNFTAALPVADGTGLWSRTPLTDGTRLAGFGFVPVQANTVVYGVPLTVVSFHAMSPATPRHTVQWAEDLAHMRRLMESYPGTVVVAGDFNATGDHRQFRDLARGEFRDAAESAGAGLFRTFPSSRPLARLDHVVTSASVDALEVGPVTIPDSDHLAVVARLRLPASDTPAS
ncbi:MAG: endonuclease/exonuclease/phosphatase family protein [Rhodococcus sp. (in: high G+C Gram-positive bacteria)]